LNYVDTSVLVAALTKEINTPRAERWLTAAAEGDVAISDWVIAEFSAALSIKLRIGSVNVDRRAAALAAFARMIDESFVVAPITSAHFRTAARLADKHQHGLRAADALHLAVSSEEGATLCTMDKRLASAGKALDISIKLI
jgi:predicted nucleic acid-binding protein